MVQIPRKAYTLEFKQEAVRLVESGQRVSEAAQPRDCGTDVGELGEGASGRQAARLNQEGGVDGRTAGDPASALGTGAGDDGRDILGKATAFFAKGQK